MRTRIITNRKWIALLVPLVLLSAYCLIAQEAVTEKPVQETEETSAEEETPTEETTPPDLTSEKHKETKSTKGLQKMMTPDEFSAAGLDKLSSTELEYLDSWLQNYRRTAEKKAATKAAEQATAKVKEETTKKVRASFFSTREPTASRIAGTLGPLTGHTILTLEDGTKWKQANPEDKFRPQVTDHPVVFVIHTAFGYRMRIPGMPEFYVTPVPDK